MKKELKFRTLEVIALLVGLLAFAPTLMNAQTFFKEGTSWKTERWNSEFDPKIHIQIVSLDGTETIDGYASMKMYSEYENDATSRKLVAYIRTDGDKVFFMNPETKSKAWYLMYDFGLKAGEGCYVYSCEFTNAEGEPLRSYVMYTGTNTTESGLTAMEVKEYYDETCDEYLGSEKWLKGLASTRGVLLNSSFALDGIGSSLLECSNNNTLLYSRNSTQVTDIEGAELKVTVNGLSVEVSGIKSPCSLTVYSPDGALLQSKMAEAGNTKLTLPKKGIYLLKVSDKERKIALTAE